MKTKRLLSIFMAMSFSGILVGQKDSTINSVTAFCKYITKEDFFNNKKTFDGTTVHKYHPDNMYVQNSDIEGCWAAEVYTVVNDFAGKVIWLYEKAGRYASVYGGGNKNTYCVIGALAATYDSQGYASSVSYADYFEIYYTDVVNKIETNKIEVLLKSKPKLLEKYLNETSRCKTNESRKFKS